MGETVLSFGDRRATIEPANASRIGAGYRGTTEESMKVYDTFDEAMADAVVYIFKV